MDRLLGSHGIQSDTAEDRIHFQQRLEQRRGEGQAPGQWDAFRRGRKNEPARERNETDEHRAERLVKEWMNLKPAVDLPQKSTEGTKALMTFPG